MHEGPKKSKLSLSYIARRIFWAILHLQANSVRKATYRDPDGNEIGFGGAPLEPA